MPLTCGNIWGQTYADNGVPISFRRSDRVFVVYRPGTFADATHVPPPLPLFTPPSIPVRIHKGVGNPLRNTPGTYVRCQMCCQMSAKSTTYKNRGYETRSHNP